MPQTKSISRREIKNLIRTYREHPSPSKGWYQNIRFLPFLETRRNVFETVTAHLRGILRKEEVVINNLPRLDGFRVIDIGCNAGLYSVEASCRGASFVLGVDRDPFRIQQANDVADAFRRLGRPLSQIEFRAVDDINNHLELVADKDVLIACCVLYHLGPLARLKEAIVKSRVKTLIFQGNVSRLGPGAGPTAAGHGEEVASLDGLRRFCASMGFTTPHTVEHAFPLIIAKR
jgi:SAM-dependent methyltransferase